MKKELEEQLIEKYPKIFNIDKLDTKEPFPIFKIECGDGWYNLLDDLCDSIQFHIDYNIKNTELESSQVVVKQIKEKFGGLRFYFRGGNEYINGMVSFAEKMSYKICEHCGTNKNVTTEGKDWIITLCNNCRDIHNKKIRF